MPEQRSEAPPDPAADYAAAAGRFFELLRGFAAAPDGRSPDWSRLAAPLAGQFQEWLRRSQAAAPWFGSSSGDASGSAAAAAGAFAPLPLGPAAPASGEFKRLLDLYGRLAQLQGELAAHWSRIANTAAQRFVTQLAAAGPPPAGIDGALQLYEQWVHCAEEAYAATAHGEDFARLQGELANVCAALIGAQRRQFETLAQAAGLPGRAELDGLADEVRELRQRLDALAAARSGPRAAARAAQPARRSAGAPRKRGGKSRRRTASPGSRGTRR